MPDLPPEIVAMMAELHRRNDVPQGVKDALDEMARIDPATPAAEKAARSNALIAEIVRLMRGRSLI
jgi:hypothetical protein